MSTTIQIICAVSLVVIALYFLVLTVLAIMAYLRIRKTIQYLREICASKLEPALDVLGSATRNLQELAESTSRKVDDFTEIIPETREKLEELIDLLDYVQDKMKNPLLNIVAAFKVLGDKFSKWT
ncbi:MAG: hypothetical protein JXQ83_07780 [Candidatus Glassbacteria bacterium]|nr:hypothetical protein [Candidatus Glassbacteria bacterium]